MITLTEKDIADLRNWALEMPTKYGLTFLQFLERKQQEINSSMDLPQEEIATTGSKVKTARSK